MENLTKTNRQINPEYSKFNLMTWVKNFREKAKKGAKQNLFRVITNFETRENVDFKSIASGEATILRTSFAFANCSRLARELKIISKQEFLIIKQFVSSSVNQYDKVYLSAINKILNVYNEVKGENV